MVSTNARFTGQRKLVTYTGPNVYTSYQSVDWPAVYHGKTTAGGPKIIYPWGPWAPVRNYKRAGTELKMSGSMMVRAQSPAIFTGNRIETYDFPADISNPLTTLRNSFAAGTGGMVGSGGTPILSSNMRNRLITECILKVGDRKANYGESLAEGRKTLSHLAQTSIRVLKAYKALKRGDFGRFVKELTGKRRKAKPGQTPANLWLEYQYAWMPLLNDIYDTYNVLKDGIDRKSLILKGIRQLTDNADYRDNRPYWWDLTGKCTVRHRCILFYRLTNSTADSFYQLGLINPVEVAWAIVPYSFVVDWFLPIGNVLEAYTALQGLTFVDGAITSKVEMAGEGSARVEPTGSYPHVFTSFKWSFEHFAIDRQKVVAPSPKLYVKSPFSSTHAVSALALLRNLRR